MRAPRILINGVHVYVRCFARRDDGGTRLVGWRRVSRFFLDVCARERFRERWVIFLLCARARAHTRGALNLVSFAERAYVFFFFFEGLMQLKVAKGVVVRGSVVVGRFLERCSFWKY